MGSVWLSKLQESFPKTQHKPGRDQTGASGDERQAGVQGMRRGKTAPRTGKLTQGRLRSMSNCKKVIPESWAFIGMRELDECQKR